MGPARPAKRNIYGSNKRELTEEELAVCQGPEPFGVLSLEFAPDKRSPCMRCHDSPE